MMLIKWSSSAGSAVTVEEAEAIQGISGYTGAGDLDIEDTAAALISAGDTVLNQTGVDHVKASDSSVLASVGAQLNGFTAEIEFDVVISCEYCDKCS